jgi:Cys-tRNA(Pro)/Cys-tRNA(Cys) deacylase
VTPAIDLALKTNTPHHVHSYEHDPKSASYGDEAVEQLGVDANQVFKTLVVQLNNGDLAVGVVPVNSTLNLKSVASTLNAKKAVMADTQKAQRVTGYLLGGISPIGQKKGLSTIIDSSAKTFETIYVSAGRRGLEIELSADDLAKLCQSQFAAIASS